MESHPTSRKKWIDKVIDLLSDIMAQEVDPEMVARVIWILGETRQPTAVPPLLKALTHRNGNIRRLAASALGKIGDRRAVGPLCKLLVDAKPQVRQYAIAALRRIGDPSALPRLQEIAHNPSEKYYNRRNAQRAIQVLNKVTSLPRESTTPLANAVKKHAEAEKRAVALSNKKEVPKSEVPLPGRKPIPLQGSSYHGFALDFHSRFQDNEWQRTGLGELTYRYKYGGEKRLVKVLSTRLADFIKKNAPFREANGIVCIPSTWKGRKYDPVPLLAKYVAQETGLPFLSDALEKVRYTDPQKELRTLAAKRRNIMSAFMVRGDVKDKRILILDDLCDSGATLQEATRVLEIAGAKEILVLVLTKTIHGS